MFTGCGTALITPFKQDGSLDEAAMRNIVENQIAAGINFLVPCGTTGESPTLSHAEHLRVVEITIEQSRGRVPVVAGAGGYDTAHVIKMIADLHKLGVSGILSVTPYYNKPTQEGLYQHYKAIANSTPLPIIVYSVQGRTNVNVEPATLLRLAEIKNIVGVKEASGSISQMASIIARVPESFTLSSLATIPSLSRSSHSAATASSRSSRTRSLASLRNSPKPLSKATSFAPANYRRNIKPSWKSTSSKPAPAQ
jgi:4-hydroxy-tetrahydrodipicolinate synthase